MQTKVIQARLGSLRTTPSTAEGATSASTPTTWEATTTVHGATARRKATGTRTHTTLLNEETLSVNFKGVCVHHSSIVGIAGKIKESAFL